MNPNALFAHESPLRAKNGRCLTFNRGRLPFLGALYAPVRVITRPSLTKMSQRLTVSVLFATHDIDEAIFINSTSYPSSVFIRQLWTLEHVPIICTRNLHGGSSLRPGGHSVVERMSRWRRIGEEWFVRQAFAEMPSVY